VHLIIHDSHRGRSTHRRRTAGRVARQRCVHFMRNALNKVNKGHAEMAAATICALFAQPRPDTVRAQLDTVADTFARQLPAVVDLLREAKAMLTAFADSRTHTGTRSGRSTPSERLNGEVKRRTDVAGIYPNTDALLRPAARVLTEHDEWQHSDRRYLSAESMALLNPPQPTALEPGREAPRDDGPPRPADGMVTLTAKQFATSHTTPWDAILAARGRST
jgi:putative transposase